MAEATPNLRLQAPLRRTGTCDECNTPRVRLIDRPKPGDVAPRWICAVCDAKPIRHS